jgi:uncharacterized protein (DUF39 family)
MNKRWLRGVTMRGYGVTLGVGLGLPIPILNEEIAQYAAVRDEDIVAQIVDYSSAYPEGIPGSLGQVDYAQLRSGHITVQDKKVPTGGLSSYSEARKIAHTLKEWIEAGNFLLTEPVESLPAAESGYSVKPLKVRETV